MDVDLIFKIAAVGILVAVLNILLQRSGREEQALMTTITAAVLGAAAAVAICFAAVSFAAPLKELASLIKNMTSSGELFIAPVMKCAAIAIVTKLASELCRDSSQSAVASSVELAGSICALSVAMPLIISMLKTIGAMA